jgi:hypothetical protein
MTSRFPAAHCICDPTVMDRDPRCPVHGTYLSVKGVECDNDNHAVGCQCHQGGPVKPDQGEGVDYHRQLSIARQRDIILSQAGALINGDREALYGDPNVGYSRLGKMWAAFLGLEVPLNAEQVLTMLALLKISRLADTPGHLDSWIDACGYLALGGEVATTPTTT